MKYEITGSDVTEFEFKPVNGVIHYGGAIKTPTQLIRIKWKVAGLYGENVCEADYGQYLIDCLVRAGYKIRSVSL